LANQGKGHSKGVNDPALLESLAAIEHERWSHWQQYLHAQCEPGSDGSLMIPSSLVERWERQSTTPYAALPDEEKESDREQVRLYLPVIAAALGDDGLQTGS
jgi:hypothetical protein